MAKTRDCDLCIDHTHACTHTHTHIHHTHPRAKFWQATTLQGGEPANPRLGKNLRPPPRHPRHSQQHYTTRSHSSPKSMFPRSNSSNRTYTRTCTIQRTSHTRDVEAIIQRRATSELDADTKLDSVLSHTRCSTTEHPRTIQHISKPWNRNSQRSQASTMIHSCGN